MPHTPGPAVKAGDTMASAVLREEEDEAHAKGGRPTLSNLWRRQAAQRQAVNFERRTRRTHGHGANAVCARTLREDRRHVATAGGARREEDMAERMRARQ